MSELIHKNDNRATIRWKLLTGASVIALMVSSPVVADDGNSHPVVWIEMGGNFDAISGLGNRFAPPFTLLTPTPGPYLKESPIDVQKPPPFTFGGDGSITFQPENSDWIFSAAIQYGRSNNNRHIQHQSAVVNAVYNPKYAKYPSLPRYNNKTSANYAETVVHQSEHHLIVDFQAGKDVGLGMLGDGSRSVLSAGVRVARFDFHSDVAIRARPEVVPYTHVFFSILPAPYFEFNAYGMHADASREFRGIGPSLSWTSTVPLAGNVQQGELELDWGLNGAVLFGKQRAKIHHHTTEKHYQGYYKHYIPGYTGPNGYYSGHYSHYNNVYDHNAPVPARSRNVAVPNIGANIGISYRIEDTKLSIGYRTDNFFGVMDGGIDGVKKTTLGFNGLYASISIGLGD